MMVSKLEVNIKKYVYSFLLFQVQSVCFRNAFSPLKITFSNLKFHILVVSLNGGTELQIQNLEVTTGPVTKIKKNKRGKTEIISC